jgi:aspartyl-tRNA(Asn)/glutamyl-tRNA(Gln) amidotransferase subunit A
MASSTDCIGAFTTNSRDMGVVIDVMAGKDPLDSTTIEREDSYRSTDVASLKGLKIGLVSEYMKEGLEPIVKEKVLTSIDKLRAAGAEIIDISLPSLPLALAVYYIVVPAEVSSNLARYDGQRYGYSNADAKSLEDSYSLSRSQGFGAEAKRRIMIGTYVLSSGYYDAYYKKAQTVRTKLIKEFNDAFTKIDLLVGPTTPSQAFKIGENTDNPLQMYLSDIMTVSANLVGVPAVSLPVSVSDGQLPVGLQLIAPQKQDAKLLKLSKLVEKEI